MDYIGIKVSPSTNVTQCIKVLRKLVPLPLSETKRRISEGEYLYKGNPIDIDDIDKALEIYVTLLNAGIEFQCIDHYDKLNRDEVLSLELLQNWSNSCHETARQLEMEDRYVLGD